MKKILFIILFLIGQAGTLFAQIVDEGHKDRMRFLQGDGVIESGPMVFMDEMRAAILPLFDVFINDAKALAAVFMIIFFAIKSYEMMAGDKKLEILPLLRPFGLVMIILWWGTFVQVVAFPTDVIAQTAKERLDIEQEKVNDLRYRRADMQMKLANHIFALGAELETAKADALKTDDENFVYKGWDKLKSIVINPVVELYMRAQISMNLLLTQLLELASLWILRTAVLVIFIIQIIYASILIILGPFAVAASVLPAFRDSLSTWIARFISVNLYLGIGYIVMLITTVFQNFAMQSEIDRYAVLIGSDGLTPDADAIYIFITNGIFSFGTVIISFLVGAIAMFTVPSISTWIISTSGVTSAASTAGRASAVVGGKVGAGAAMLTGKK